MYKGLAVGGSKAGEWIECENPVYRVPILNDVPILYNPNSYADMNATVISSEEYRLAVGLRGEFDIDLWLHDRLTISDALALVFRFYGTHARHIDGDD